MGVDFKHYILEEDHSVRAARDLMEWAQYFESADRLVARTEFPNLNSRVSTVFLGINHNWGEGPPLLFESMLFEDGSLADTECNRYATWDEAVAGHKAMVERYMEYLGAGVKRIEAEPRNSLG